MLNLSNVNGLLSLNKQEIIDQNYIKENVIYNIKQILLSNINIIRKARARQNKHFVLSEWGAILDKKTRQICV